MPARLKTTLSRARSAAATGLQPPQKRSTRRVMMRQMPLSTVFAPVHPQFRAAFNQTPVGGALSLHLIMVHDLLRIGTALGGEIMHAFTVTTPAYLRLKPNGHMPSSAHAKSNIASNATVPGHTRGFSRIRKTDGLVPLPPTFKARIRHRQVQRLTGMPAECVFAGSTFTNTRDCPEPQTYHVRNHFMPSTPSWLSRSKPIATHTFPAGIGSVHSFPRHYDHTPLYISGQGLMADRCRRRHTGHTIPAR